MASFAFIVRGIENTIEFEGIKDEVNTWAYQAINKAARDGRADAAQMIRDEVAFPGNYLAPAQKRLFVSKQAQRNSLEAVITARGRPTSLARFITGSPSKGRGVTVQVSPGKTIKLDQAFLIKLRAGADPIETRFNQGLAVRLKPGNRLRNKKYVVQVDTGLYVLYGPSVSQVFLDKTEKNGVAVDITDDILDQMETEFLRLMRRDLG